jgi:hypothetical protein
VITELDLGFFNGFFALMTWVGFVDNPLAIALNVNLKCRVLAH